MNGCSHIDTFKRLATGRAIVALLRVSHATLLAVRVPLTAQVVIGGHLALSTHYGCGVLVGHAVRVCC
jgi:hypothetical protein